MVVLAPWMLGTTTYETIWMLNSMGYLLGILWLTKHLIGLLSNSDKRSDSTIKGAYWPITLVYLLVIVLLLYVLCSALNPRANLQYTFTPGFPVASGVEINYLEPVDGLPQTHDQNRTLQAFWKYLAIVLSFFAARDWLMGVRGKYPSESNGAVFPNNRMQCLLWTLAINSAAVAFAGMLQRLDGSQKLLWLFDNHLNGGEGAFGPYPYRSSGAQYLNLMWPVTLGFWWVTRRRGLAGRSLGSRSGGDPHILLLVFAVLTAAGVFVANSRGGLLVLVGLLVATLALVVVFAKRQLGVKIAVATVVIVVVGLGGWLGGEAMMKRFKGEDLEKMSGRKLIYQDTARMAKDFALFGSGAETFAPLYYFYRSVDPDWNAYVHDDYLETRVTFGAVGFGIILLIFSTIWLVPSFGRGFPAPTEFILMLGVSMVGILAHAKFDLPFQIYSIHFEFIILCALLTCLRWQRR